MKAPEGATHFHYCYGSVSFWRRKESMYLPESNRWLSFWHYWNNGKWVEDRTACSRHFHPIEKYDPAVYG